MIEIRQAADRGHANYGWLDTYHTFSFNTYRDPRYRNFRALRVINEDVVQPGQGFGTHPHNDMEIITYVLDGALAHRDSMGNGEVIHAGELQRMSAGTGITHSEFNPSETEPVHLYQIWLFPERKGIEPSYEQRKFADQERHNRLRLVASPGGRDDSLRIHQDAQLYLATLDEDAAVEHTLAGDRHAWLQVLRGEVELDGQPLTAGDGAAVSDESQLQIRAQGPADILLFDLG
ncbi:MAG: pirin family protein [Planctomycetota bacterium]|nr:MAG: pirin family protein [Planctomycetota bacterium]